MRQPLLRLFVLMVLTACGIRTPMCERENVICEPGLPPPRPEATSATLFFENLSWALNERAVRLYPELLSPDFRFVDETTRTETVGREQEGTTVERVFNTYRDIDFGLYGDVREEADHGCLVVCGLVQMRLVLDSESGFTVNDETCLTACPNIADGLWHLTEWRIVRAVPPARKKEGFEVMTWAEVKRLFPREGRGETNPC